MSVTILMFPSIQPHFLSCTYLLPFILFPQYFPSGAFFFILIIIIDQVLTVLPQWYLNINEALENVT